MLLKFGTKPSEVVKLPLREKMFMLRVFAEQGERNEQLAKSLS